MSVPNTKLVYIVILQIKPDPEKKKEFFKEFCASEN